MPAIKGLFAEPLNPLSYTSFANSAWTQPEGPAPTRLSQAKVFNVNMTNWTVDVKTIFDQQLFLDIQVSSPYLNPSQGEGLYCVPEIGSRCIVCLPGDGSPPFVLAFLMPLVHLNNKSEEAPEGTAPRGGASTGGDYTWAGGRKKGKPGDIVARTRDGNFMILHRGGVAQFGSSPLAQRICVPLINLVTDISQNYNHFNSGGSINWGVQDKSGDDPPTEHRHTLRVYANDEYADLRFSAGYVHSPVPEPVGDDGETSRDTQLGIGTDEDTVFEFVLARNGFETHAGDFKGEAEDVKLRIFVDRAGNMMGRWEGSVNLRIKKKLYITVDEDAVITCKGNATIHADGLLKLTSSSGADLTTEGVLTLNAGTKPMATVGSSVQVPIVPGMLQVVSNSVPPTPIGTVIPTLGYLSGTITDGNPTILG